MFFTLEHSPSPYVCLGFDNTTRHCNALKYSSMYISICKFVDLPLCWMMIKRRFSHQLTHNPHFIVQETSKESAFTCGEWRESSKDRLGGVHHPPVLRTQVVKQNKIYSSYKHWDFNVFFLKQIKGKVSLCLIYCSVLLFPFWFCLVQVCSQQKHPWNTWTLDIFLEKSASWSLMVWKMLLTAQ